MNQSITFSVDLEVQLTQWKIGLEIFDLAVVCRENPEIRFESNKQINSSEKRLLTFEEYAPIMIKQLSEYCQQTPHDNVYFLAHNGFSHDYIIILDNLERTKHLDYFTESFKDALFLDSLSFFKSYKNNHKGQFIHDDNQQVSLSLTSLCDYFLKLKYYAHTAMSDAESLIKLMDYQPRGAGGFSFLMLNEHKDYSEHCKTLPEVSEIYNKKKKIEAIRNVPGYGAQYKQMEVALSSESVNTECIHALLDEGINWFSLVEFGKTLTRKEIDQRLKSIIWSNAQRGKIVNWCLKFSEKASEMQVEEEEEELDIKQGEREIKKEENLNEKERKKTEKFIEAEKKREEKEKEKERLKAERQEEKRKQREEKLKEIGKQKEIKKEENLNEKERQRTEKLIEAEKKAEERQKELEKQREERQKEKERLKAERQKQKKKHEKEEVENEDKEKEQPESVPLQEMN